MIDFTIFHSCGGFNPSSNIFFYPFVSNFSQVKSGEMPVLDARVRAVIQFTGTPTNYDSSASNNTLVLDLLDNGNAGMCKFFINSIILYTKLMTIILT